VPIEIKELHIKATVNSGKNQSAAESVETTASKDKIVAACVEQVLQILRDKKEK